MENHKKKYMPLYKFMKSHGMKFKEAAVKKHSVLYFRMDQFKAFLEAKSKEIEANENISKLLQNW